MTDTATISTKIPFTKMQGAGNDYIYVNTLLYSRSPAVVRLRDFFYPHLDMKVHFATELH